MIPRRAATAVLIGAVLTLMAACTGQPPPSATWHPAPARAGQASGAALNVTTAGGPTGPAVTSAAHPAVPTAPYGAADALAAVRKTTGTQAVALTFDDGPSSYTPQILAILRQYNVKATFCVLGVEVRAHPDLVRQIVREGHSLCNHTWSHDLELGQKSPAEIRADLRATAAEIHRAVPGAPIRYFRHPGGNFTPAAVAVARELGMACLGWLVDTNDWDVKKYGPDMTNHILAEVRRSTRPGSIVLAHDAGGDRAATMAAFRILVPELKAHFTLTAL